MSITSQPNDRQWCIWLLHDWGAWSSGEIQMRHCKRCNREQRKHPKGWMST